MKVTLVRPYYRTHLVTPLLGLAYLSAVLKRSGHSVRVIDGVNWIRSNERIADECVKSDLVGIFCLSAFYREVVALAQAVRRKGVRVVIGGPHATCLPEETLRDTGVDFVVVGEAEKTIVELVSSLEKTGSAVNVQGMIGQGIEYRSRGLIEDLDELPRPDWSDMPPHAYRMAPYGGFVKAYPIAPIMTSRGCSCRCSFCASPRLWGGRVRYRSPEAVVDEVAWLIKDYGVREIHFVDDNITAKRAHIEGICEGMLRQGVKVPWALPNGTRVDGASYELFELMRRSGCYSVAFGIESGNQEILDDIQKGTSIASITQAVHCASRAGLITQGFFIYGFPKETVQTMQQTLDLAMSLPLDKAEFQVLDILPGSHLWTRLANKTKRPGEYESYLEPAWSPPSVTEEELVKMQGHSLRRFFLRPRQMWTVLRHLKVRQMPSVLRRLWSYHVFAK